MAPRVPSGMRRVLVGVIAVAVSVPTAHASDVDIVRVIPSVRDSMLVCHLETRGLPDVPSRETLESGLPSAIILALTLVGDHEAAGTRRSDIRIEPDLWEGTVVVRTPLLDHRVSSIDEVAALLRRLGPLPLAPLRLLGDATTWEVTARIAVHPLAPAEVARVRSLFGEDAGTRREVLVGIGSLVDYFFGDPPDEDWVGEATSSPFRPGDLETSE